MIIPEHIIDEIKEKADIVEVIGEEIELKRTGSNFVGFSPFNQEKTPSFVVSPDKKIFKDFSSGKAGNVISFLTQYHGMTFVEACKNLAKKYGIELGEKVDEDDESFRKNNAYKVAEYAADKYHKLLFTKDGNSTYKYFLSRNFSDDLIKKFKLGYCPDSWDFILQNAVSSGFSKQNLLDAGLIIEKKEQNKTYDRFRKRAIFTIRDYIGRTIGFGARILSDEKNQPKYINSPQSLIYDKSNVLYGLYEGKNAIRNKKEAILVEGYADVLAMAEAGFENVIAASGTSLTIGQLKLLKRFSKKLYFMLDADRAGQSATEKGLILALEQDFEVKIVNLSENEDPDSMIKKNGRTSIELAIRDSMDFIDFKIDVYKKSGSMDSPKDLSQGVRELVQIVKKIPDKLQHDFYISKIASAFSLTENQLKQVYREKQKIATKQNIKKTDEEQSKKIYDSSRKEQILNNISPEELLLIKYILTDEENLHILLEKYELGIESFISGMGRRMFNIVLKHSDKKNIIDSIINDENTDINLKDIITDIIIKEETPSENWKQFMNSSDVNYDEIAIKDALKNISIKKIEMEIKSLNDKLKKDPENFEIRQSINSLNIQRYRIFNNITSDS